MINKVSTMSNGVKKILNTMLKKPYIIIIIGIVLYFVIFSYISVWKYQNFQYNGMDLAIINQAFFNSTQGDWLASSIHPPSYLGDHFTPILFLLLPIYLLFKSPVTILILQTAALALAAWPLYLITKKVLSKNWALFISLAWLSNPLVQNVNLFEFHFLPFAAFFIFWTFYFYQNKKFLPFILFGFLALLVREDVSFIIVMFGILAIFDKQKIKWIITPIILSALYFIIAIKLSSWIAPSEQYKFLLYYSWIGGSWFEIIKNILLHPWILLPKIFSPGSIIVALGLLLPSAYLPLLKPKYLLLSSLIYLQLVIGVGWNWLAMILYTQYSSLLLPGIFIATIFGIERLFKINFKNEVVQAIFQERRLVVMAIVGTLIYTTMLMGPLPGSALKIAKNGHIAPETQLKNLLLAQVPTNAPVSATYAFLTPLSSRDNITSLNYVFLGKQQFLFNDYELPADTQYLLIDFQDLLTYQLQYDNNLFFQQQYDYGINNWPNVLKNFGLIDIKNSYGLFQKGQKNKFELINTFNQPPEITFAGNLSGDTNIKFIGHNKLGNNLQLFWRQDSPINKNYYIKLKIITDDVIQYTKIYPLGYGLLTSAEVKNKKIIQTNYWLEFMDDMPNTDYVVDIDLIEIINGGVEVDALRGTENVIDTEITIAENILSTTFNL